MTKFCNQVFFTKIRSSHETSNILAESQSKVFHENMQKASPLVFQQGPTNIAVQYIFFFKKKQTYPVDIVLGGETSLCCPLGFLRSTTLRVTVGFRVPA